MIKNAGVDILPVDRIVPNIYVVRDRKVMIDTDLAALYGVETRVLNQAVRRNPERFPEDFMFRLSEAEGQALRSQIVILNEGEDASLGRGQHSKYSPFAFTEQGVAMLSSVLRSPRAVQVNISIMRTFVRIRQVLATHEELARKVTQHDRQITVLVEHVQKLLTPPPSPSKKKPIGFTAVAAAKA